MTTRRAIEIEAPGAARVVTEELRDPAPGELLVTSEWGALSLGSEGLAFRGGLPSDLRLDDTAGALNASAGYPMRYGYILSGRVSAVGAGVDAAEWLGKRVFAFHPHASAACVPATEVLVVPPETDPSVVPLYANTETALSLHWDAAILPGESVAVLGCGIVGLLVLGMSLRGAAAAVAVVEPDPVRREWAASYAAATSSESQGRVAFFDGVAAARRWLETRPGAYAGLYRGADCTFDLTGAPPALDSAIEITAFGGRVVMGSWYGNQPVTAALGGRFHRSRIQLVSSQVSTVPLGVAGRIDRERRTRMVWDILPRLAAEHLPRRTVGLAGIPEVYRRVRDGVSVEPWVAVDYAQQEE